MILTFSSLLRNASVYLLLQKIIRNQQSIKEPTFSDASCLKLFITISLEGYKGQLLIYQWHYPGIKSTSQHKYTVGKMLGRGFLFGRFGVFFFFSFVVLGFFYYYYSCKQGFALLQTLNAHSCQALQTPEHQHPCLKSVSDIYSAEITQTVANLPLLPLKNRQTNK